MFAAEISQRQVIFSWSPPLVAQRNGLIISYTLSCSPSPTSLPQFPSQSGLLMVTGFSPDTSYSCSVVANNSLGSGPPAHTTFTTIQDCKLFTSLDAGLYNIYPVVLMGCLFLDSLFQIRLVGLTTTCSEFVVS